MSTVNCFWMTETDRTRQYLRRYAGEAPCAVRSYHQTWTRIEDAPLVRHERGYIKAKDWPRDDPRWPKACECGYVFKESDNWQLFQDPIYATADGNEYSLRDAPAGAMWDARWMRSGGPDDWAGADGISLMVKLPNGRDWCVDGPSTNGDGWTRTGTVPKVTANPSILAADYHGWLRDGQLVEA